jgi:hypothetical protein
MMAMRGYKQRFLRLVAAVAIGGSVFQLGGCDPTVRSTLLMGLESTTNALTDTLVSAFFISLQDDEDGTTQDALTTT